MFVMVMTMVMASLMVLTTVRQLRTPIRLTLLRWVACDEDDDDDSVADTEDERPLVANTEQTDSDANGQRYLRYGR